MAQQQVQKRAAKRETLRPTIQKLATLAGCSIATVSKALSGSPVVAEPTRRRIAGLAAEIGYVASLRGVTLRTGRTYQAAVLMPMPSADDHEWEGVEYTHILSGISRALAGSPYHVSVHLVHGGDEMAVLRKIVERREADGIIFSGTRPQDPRITYLLEQNFPFVVMGQSEHAQPYPFVDIDNQTLAFDSTSRLIAKGHRRIALVNPDEGLMYARQRIAGYRAALAAAKIPFDADLVAAGRLSAAFGKASVAKMGALAAPPTGYLCINEASALGVMAGLRENGLVIGQDAVVIGYDDINVSAYFNPPITTYYQPIEEMSATLGAFLLRRIDGEAPEGLRRIYLPRLIERQADATL